MSSQHFVQQPAEHDISGASPSSDDKQSATRSFIIPLERSKHNCGGTVPVKSLPETKNDRTANCIISTAGIVPVKRLLRRSRETKSVTVPIVLLMVPVKLQFCK
jgi:hypothetical protein